MATLLLTISAATGASAQTPRPRPAERPLPPRVPPTAVSVFPRETVEKRIQTDPRVNLSLCVTEGDVKISGWERNEVRVFVKNGSGVGFKVLQQSRQTQSPVWINVLGFAPDKTKPGVHNECLSGDSIEIDVPTGATIGIKGRETKTRIESVRRVDIKNAGGDISVRNISEGVSAATYEGDIIVERSEGPIALDSATGNIIVFDAAPGQVGDTFKAKSTSGAIMLEKLDYRQIEVYSITGQVLFNGGLSTGGIYSFGTTSGAVTLGIPKDSSVMVSAAYGFGSFNSSLPLKTLTENVSSAGKSVTAQMGEGDSKLNLTTASGAILIKAQ